MENGASNKKQSYALTNRVFSLLLALLMVITMLPSPTFALPAGVSIESSGADPITELPKALTDGQIWTDKSVENLGSGEFRITLSAAGQDYILETVKDSLDVVLVLDISGSMTSGTRNADMKAAATEAMNTILLNPNNRIALVSYNEYATLNQNFTGNSGTLSSSLSGINAQEDTGTNIQRAIYIAQKAIKDRPTGEQTRKSVIILMSDGKPTYYYDGVITSTNNLLRQGNGGDTTSNHIWNTILQAMEAKDKISGLKIYTIGFGVNSDADAIATLMPDATNTYDHRPDGNTYSGQMRTRLRTGYYLYSSTRANANATWSDWALVEDPTVYYDRETTYGPWVELTNQPVILQDTWGPYVKSGNPLYTNVTGNKRTAYFYITRNGIEYDDFEKEPIAFNHKYWEDGSTVSATTSQQLKDAFKAIANEIVSFKPHAQVPANGYSDVIIRDVLGAGFELIGTPPAGVSLSSGVLTWTIDGDTFVTQDAGTAALNPQKVTKVSFNVKIGNVGPGTYYTNDTTATKSSFNVKTENPYYTASGLIETPLTNKGWVKLVAPDVEGKITITKNLVGPTSNQRDFSFSIYDAASGGNLIAGPMTIYMNGAGSKPQDIEFSVPYNAFNANNQLTLYVQENDSTTEPFWTYDNTARKAVTVTRTNPNGSVSFTNTYAPKGELTVKKNWSGNGPKDDISFDLLKETAPGVWTTVSEGWTIDEGDVDGITISGLDLDFRYKVQEDFLQDYTPSYDVPSIIFSSADITAGVTGALEKTITITNTYVQPVGKITVNKIWSDSENAAGDRPISLLYNITGPDGYTGTLTLTKNGGWSNVFETTTFGTYTFTEVVPQDYEAALNPQSQTISIDPVKDREAILTFTNTYIPPTGTLVIEKVWSGDQGKTQYRPSEIKIDVLKKNPDTGLFEATGKVLTLSNENAWMDQINNLPFGEYKVEEQAFSGLGTDYLASYSSNVILEKMGATNGILARTGKIVVTNSFQNPTGEISVSKEWVESGVDSGVVRPSDLTVTLFKDGSEIDHFVMNASAGWSHTFENLPLDASYTVTETSSEAAKLAQYASTITYSGTQPSSSVVLNKDNRAGSIALVNKYAKGTVTVIKTWNDGTNPINEQPQTAVVTLHKVIALPAPPPIEMQNPDGEGVILVEQPVPAVVEETVTKSITRPNLSVTFYDLEMSPFVSYYVTEEDIPFYTKAITNGEFALMENLPNHSVNISNTYTDPKGSLTVNKEWKHGNNPNGPSEVTVRLWNGSELVEARTFTGSTTFTGLNIGTTYTISEDPVNNYSTSMNGFISYTPKKDLMNGTVNIGTANITNTYIPEVGDLVVEKVWEGKTGSDITVTVTRYAGDAKDDDFIRTAVLSASEIEANNWRAIFNDLEIYGPGGVQYTYHVTESGDDLALYDAVISGYTDLNVEEPSTITITNTYNPLKGKLVITKVWKDAEGEPIEPEYSEVELQLIVNGEPAQGTMKLNAENDWTWTLSNLNTEKTYSVVELDEFEEFEVGYSAEDITFSAEDLEKSIVVTNQRTVDDPKIDVTKEVTPATVQLLSGTATFTYKVTLTNTGNRTLYAIGIEDEMTGPSGATMTYNPAPTSFSEGIATFELEKALAPGASEVISYTVTVNRIGTYDNTVTGFGYHIETRISDTADARANATEQPTEPPTEPPTNPPTTEPPTTQPPTTEPTTEVTSEVVVETEETPLGEAVTEEVIDEDVVPLGDALPQTGQLPVDLFYGIGGVVTALGVYLRRRK